MYTATITHSSISSARTIQCPSNLAQAKRQATAEFGEEFVDYLIVILDEQGQTVASRRAGSKSWNSKQQ